MAEDKVKFYNMIIHLIKNNKLYEENVAIKNVWQKNETTLFDIYFYRNQKSYVFDAVFIHDLFDLTTEKYYKSPKSFIKDFKNNEVLPAAAVVEPEVSLIDEKLFEPLQVDLIIMTFMANCGHNSTPIKDKIIFDYITAHISKSRNLTPQYIKTYLEGIKPAEDDFYAALTQIKTKHPAAASELVKETVKLCLADGQLHYDEKMYIAEIFQLLREEGVEPDVGL